MLKINKFYSTSDAPVACQNINLAHISMQQAFKSLLLTQINQHGGSHQRPLLKASSSSINESHLSTRSVYLSTSPRVSVCNRFMAALDKGTLNLQSSSRI